MSECLRFSTTRSRVRYAGTRLQAISLERPCFFILAISVVRSPIAALPSAIVAMLRCIRSASAVTTSVFIGMCGSDLETCVESVHVIPQFPNITGQTCVRASIARKSFGLRSQNF